MMKRVIFFLLIFFSLLSEVEAQENIYIYRNDGMFNAFSKSEVDSIEYSKYDENGILGEEWKMQLIYTADSIYSIPLAVIDSVSFYAPQTILNNNVFMLTASHDPYLSDADTLSFVLASTTPAQMVPKKGNIVFSTVDCLSFEHGIMARVVSKQNVSDGIKFDCEKVALDDIYDQIVAYGELKSNEADLAKVVQNHAVGATFEKNFTLWNRDYEDTLENGGTKTDYGISDAASAKFTVCKILGKPMSVTLEFDNQFKSNVKFNATSSVGQYYAKKLGKTINCGRIPIPNTGLWIVPKLDLYAYFEEVGKISLDFAAHLNRMDKFIIKYCDKQWSTEYKPLTDAGIDVASLSMKGYAEIGVNPQILFSLCGSATGIGINYKVGLRENIDFEFDAIKQFDSGTYDALKDSYARTTIPQEFSVFAQAGLFGKGESSRYEHKPLAWETQWGSDKYLFPEFSKPSYFVNESTKTVVLKTTVLRNLLFPVNIGMVVYDSNKKVVESQYMVSQYQNNTTSFEKIFSGLKEHTQYKANPVFKMMGQEWVATPSLDFKFGIDLCPDDKHPHMIDLGLPSGVKWACCNIDSKSPEIKGGEYAWGETELKDYCDDRNSKYVHWAGKCEFLAWYPSTDTYEETWQQTYSYDNIGHEISGTDNDVAKVKWGNSWQMPSKSVFSELLNNVQVQRYNYKGTDGYLLTGNSGNSIFIPDDIYWTGSFEGLKYCGIHEKEEHITEVRSFEVFFSHYSERFEFYGGAIWFGNRIRPISSDK